MKKQMVAMFDGVQPEAMERELAEHHQTSQLLRLHYLRISDGETNLFDSM